MSAAKRILLTSDPFAHLPPAQGEWASWMERGLWPAHWISLPQPVSLPLLSAYVLAFSLPRAAKFRVHVSADERYELFLDGARIGRGPERGDLKNWFFESYELTLEAGPHRLAARVWSLGESSPLAQLSLRPGFLLAAEGPGQELLSTGKAPWRVKRLGGLGFTPNPVCFGAGENLVIDGAAYSWGFEDGAGEGWEEAQVHERGCDGPRRNEFRPTRLMRPAALPAMLERPWKKGQVRLAEGPPLKDWQAFLEGRSPLRLAAGQKARAIVDLEDYLCAYPELATRGKGEVEILWAESLYLDPQGPHKGQRDQVEGKHFRGVGDRFLADGPARTFSLLWWQAGRYLEITASAGQEPLELESLNLLETRYPLEMEARFGASDPRMGEFLPIGLRGLQMCSHETFMDCPYYEQLMYVGDTRLECLATYALARDARLPRKAVELFDVSRFPSGLTQSRYPSRVTQFIPPFSLWWVGMLHDYALWRGEPGFVRARMPGARAVLDAFLALRNKAGLVEAPEGWNFMDWVPGWPAGVPAGGESGVSAMINWQMVGMLELAARLEEWLGEPELAQRQRRHAGGLAEALVKAFWIPKRGLFADDASKKRFSEHTQCLALLSGHLPPSLRKPLAKGLLEAKDLQRTTIYFTHYLFEALAALGRADRIQERLGLWWEHKAMGMKTPLEMPEPSRSDCHAWGSHPLYHYFATILGIRPSDFGFGSVEIAPQLGPLDSASGRLPHPLGFIELDLKKKKGGALSGSATLPKGLGGTLILGSRRRALKPGFQKF